MLRVAPLGPTHRQTSPGKSFHLPAYARRIYFRVFRAGTGLRVFAPSHPTRLPPMRFLFVGPAACLQLPSDPASRRAPLPLTHRSPCRVGRGLGMLRARRTSWREPMPGAGMGRRRGHPRRPPTPPYVRFRIRRFTKPSASGDAVREGSPVHGSTTSSSILCSLRSTFPVPAVTFDAPLALPRRFRRLPPAADSGISAILSSVSLVIEVQAPTPLRVRAFGRVEPAYYALC